MQYQFIPILSYREMIAPLTSKNPPSQVRSVVFPWYYVHRPVISSLHIHCTYRHVKLQHIDLYICLYSAQSYKTNKDKKRIVLAWAALFSTQPTFTFIFFAEIYLSKSEEAIVGPNLLCFISPFH